MSVTKIGEFSLGDVVRLKSGGPWMTIQDVVEGTDTEFEYATTTWWPLSGDPNLVTQSWEDETTVHDFAIHLLEKKIP